MDVAERFLAEDRRDRVRQSIDQPLFAKIVVQRHHAARRQVVAHRFERLSGEHVALETHAREARLHGQRVDQREDDQVVLPVAGPQKMPRIVVDDGHARIAVGMVGMPFGAEAENHRIDIDRVDMFRAVLQRRGDVSAAAGAENQDVVERVAEHACTATDRSIPCARPAPSTGGRCGSPRRRCRRDPGRR